MAKEFMTMDEYSATLVGGNMRSKGMAKGGKVGMKKKRLRQRWCCRHEKEGHG